MDKQTLIEELLSETALGRPKEIRVRPEVVKILTNKINRQAELYLRGVPIVVDDFLQVPWKVIQK